VSPLTVAVKVTGLPTVGEALTVKVAMRGEPATLTVWLDEVVAEVVSVTVRAAVFAPFEE